MEKLQPINNQTIGTSKVRKTFDFMRIWVVQPEDYLKINENYQFIIYFNKNWSRNKDTFYVAHNYPDYKTAETAMELFMEKNFNLLKNQEWND